MAALRSLHAALGHNSVTTYIQSGNVVFDTAATNSAALTASIENAIGEEFGFEVPVILRSREEFVAAVEANPYPDRGADLSRVAIVFSQRAPAAGRLQSIDALAHCPDEFTINGREVHLHCPTGFGRTKLTNVFFEKRLGIVATSRNWRTVSKLLELLDR